MKQAPVKPFDEPWLAQAFALVVALNEAGHLPWDEWADAFSSTLAANQPDGVDAACQALPQTALANAAYWRSWLQTLERLLHARGIVAPLQLTAHREAVRAYNGVSPATAMFRVDESEKQADAS